MSEERARQVFQGRRVMSNEAQCCGPHSHARVGADVVGSATMPSSTQQSLYSAKRRMAMRAHSTTRMTINIY